MTMANFYSTCLPFPLRAEAEESAACSPLAFTPLITNWPPLKLLTIRNFSEGDFDENGVLKKPLILKPRFHIHTEVNVESSSPAVQDSITINVTLQAAAEPVAIILPNTQPNEGKMGGLFLRNIRTEEIHLVRTLFLSPQGEFVPIERNEAVVVTRTGMIRTTTFVPAEKDVPAGQYKVIPYLLARSQDTPEEMLNSLGENLESFGPEYLTIPFLRKNGTLNLSPTAQFKGHEFTAR